MLVDRRTLNIQAGGMEEALKILSSERSRMGWKRAIRIYSPSVASFDQIIVEFVFENLAEMEEFWNTWGATPGADEFWGKWNEASATGGRREIWELVD